MLNLYNTLLEYDQFTFYDEFFNQNKDIEFAISIMYNKIYKQQKYIILSNAEKQCDIRIREDVEYEMIPLLFNRDLIILKNKSGNKKIHIIGKKNSKGVI